MLNLSDIAKELNISNQELRERAQAAGFKLKISVRKIDERTAAKMIKAIKAQLEKEREKEEKIVLEKIKKVSLPESITVREFSTRIGIKPVDVIKQLMKNGVMANINEEIDFDTAAIIASDFGIKVEKEKIRDLKEIGVRKKLKEKFAKKKLKLKERPPVVVVIGHVDHGKSTLLEGIQEVSITSKEFGGITQHIGAYQVKHKNKLITFLDTPGHEAFTAMRERGAKVTDIAVLVVAADDGVKPQTIEAIRHAKKYNLPLVVAINKIDKPEADPERVKKELADQGVMVEGWGGHVVCQEISAKEKKNLDKLLDLILLVAEMEELKAEFDVPALGTVIEAHLDHERGPVVTVLVQNGTLKIGDAITCGRAFGIVRSLENFLGKKIDYAEPSTPVRILGLDSVPEVGDVLNVEKNKEQAKARVMKLKKFMPQIPVTREIKGKKLLNLIIKTDVTGSLDAVLGALAQLETSKVAPHVIHFGVGKINESDIIRASSSNAVILGFHVDISPVAKRLAENEKVKYKIYEVIYELTDEVEKMLEKMIEPEIKRVKLGRLKVLAVFRTEKKRIILGGKVTSGKLKRDLQIEVIRNDEKIGEGKLVNLQINKANVQEVEQGKECGIEFEGEIKIKEGDILEAWKEEKIKRNL